MRTEPHWPEEHRYPAEGEAPSLAELTQRIGPNIEALQGAKIVAGLPCYNSEPTVGHVVRAIETGLRRYYPDVPSAIVILDSNSSDRTVQLGLEASTRTDEDLLLIPKGAPLPARTATRLYGTRGKGNALRPLFTIARAIGAAACVTFDSDLRSIQPSWVEHLVGPVLDYGWDHVTPLYVRHRNDGTITNSIAYPVTASLYGRRVRQPIGGDFGFSGRIASTWAEKDVWNSEVARFGVDVWMTTSALANGYRVAQARLGAKIHDPKDPSAHLGPMFRQVVATLFHLAGEYADRWELVDEIRPTPLYGFPSAAGTDVVEVNVPGLLEQFVRGIAEHAETLRSVLAPDTLERVLRAASDPMPDSVDVPIELWIDIVQDFLVAANAGVYEDRDLINAMIGLYFARTATFVREAAHDTQDEAEDRLDGYPDLFLSRKDRLRERWAAAVPSIG